MTKMVLWWGGTYTEAPGPCQRAARTRRGRTTERGLPDDRRGHVGGDFRDRKGAVVDADLVDHALEELAGRRRVSADAEGAVADGDGVERRRRDRVGGSDQRAVHVEALGRAVVGRGEVRPDAQRQLRGAADSLVGRPAHVVQTHVAGGDRLSS